MELTLSQLCQTLEQHGMKPVLRGDGQRLIRGVATLEEAQKGQISFLSNPKYERMLATTGASAVVLKPDVDAPDQLDLIQVADPYAAITALIVRLYGYRRHRRVPPEPSQTNIAPNARLGENPTIHAGVTIEEDVVIGDNAVIYPGCYIGPRCRIGNNLILYPNVVIYEDAIIGDRVTIHSGTVVGNDGLGYAPVDDKWVKIPQIGIVEIGDDVEIGSNCSIDRATLGKTSIGSGTKLSNLIAVGHGAQIGEDCLLVAQVGLAGSVQVGRHVTMAGQAGVVGHVHIGDNATIGAKAGVTHNVAAGETVLGQPAIPIAEMKRRLAHIGRLPELRQTVKKLEKQIAELEARLEEFQSVQLRSAREQ
ncbi:MAG TPA: UDP-3-O-(3-hydroxymyristoyl)glucosamine N-acyltransferase [Phycisphaerae bacterium]|nr:UDP-3-O-(3-hydroxymyristoyl)glucosamine N-acyltransferase [Phycisphaerae bacterium]